MWWVRRLYISIKYSISLQLHFFHDNKQQTTRHRLTAGRPRSYHSCIMIGCNLVQLLRKMNVGCSHIAVASQSGSQWSVGAKSHDVAWRRVAWSSLSQSRDSHNCEQRLSGSRYQMSVVTTTTMTTTMRDENDEGEEHGASGGSRCWWDDDKKTISCATSRWIQVRRRHSRDQLNDGC